MSFEEIIAGLRALKPEDFDDNNEQADGLERLYHLTDSLLQLPNPKRATSELFAVIERLPNSDLGSPGPLVHTLEKLDYVDELIASISRQPTELTVWMVNRALNAQRPNQGRNTLLSSLEQAIEHPNADDSTRQLAKEFLDFQSD